MTNRNWRDYSYLAQGSPAQQAAWAVLNELRLDAVLRAYSPVLVGVFPLDLAVDGSELDIACEAHDLNTFARRLKRAFGHRENFTLKKAEEDGLPAAIARFTSGGLGLALFGQARPVREQHAFRHMLVEMRLLALAGPRAREAILQFKQEGLSTEPAFARYFGLSGDPHQRLLELSTLDESMLRAALRR